MSKQRERENDVEKICEYCGEKYYVKAYRQNITKFCSKECRHKWEKGSRKGEWSKSICPSCGKSFEFLASKPKKYCSSQCNKARLDTKVKVNCASCGKEFYITQGRYAKYLSGAQTNIYCSKECSSKGQQTGMTVTCGYCGKLFYVNGYRLKKDLLFCSSECYFNHMAEEVLVEQICPNCNTSFTSKRFLHQKFCSIQCHNEYQKTHCTEERREKSRVVASHVLRELGQSKGRTKPQQITNQILDDLGISFVNEYRIGRYSVDNYIANENLMIEVQGDYFHCNPLLYPNGPTHKLQQKRIKSDKSKHSYMLEHYGVEILYLWEWDIIHDFTKCKKLIELYLATQGKLPEYNSLNWRLVENDLILNDYCIIPFQELKPITKMSA